MRKNSFAVVCDINIWGQVAQPDAMKFSDVLILVGVGMLCAGFIIHGWVETTQLSSDDEKPYVKSVHLLKGDQLNIFFECEEDCSGEATISKDSTIIEQYGFELTSSGVFKQYFESMEYAEYNVDINLNAGEGQVDVDVKRVLMLDFIIYPIGAAILIYGLQKRRNELETSSIDAELES